MPEFQLCEWCARSHDCLRDSVCWKEREYEELALEQEARDMEEAYYLWLHSQQYE